MFHRSNCGAVESQNFGIRIVKKEWIAFVESNDLVTLLDIEELFSTALRVSVLITSFRKSIHFTDESDLKLIERSEDYLISCKGDCK